MKLILATLMIFGFNFAIAADKSDVRELIRANRAALADTNATPSELDQVVALLETSLSVLENGSGGGGNAECIEFAYEKYYINHSSSTAMDKATAACRIIQDVDVARVAYDKYYINFSATSSMDKAAQAASKNAYGKSEILEFSYSKYYISLSASSSMDKAVEVIRAVRSNALSCLQVSYENYYKSFSAVTAMNKAKEACQ